MQPHATRWGIMFKAYRWKGDKATVDIRYYRSKKEAEEHAKFVYGVLKQSPADHLYLYEAIITPPKGVGREYRYMRKVNNKYRQKPPNNS